MKKTIKRRLIDRFHDDIVISKNWYNQRCNNKEEEEFRILKAASEIIRRHIRTQVYDNKNYPPSDKMLEDVDGSISKLLKFLLSEIILKDKKNKAEIIPNYEKKRKSIEHAIISAVRP
ncbi:hypothetical protein ILUMI_04384 [Ignelater luminosus]|uniref:Uncharacterized protein n=1 Tax=Ignelater luminosus TaxID=2038154 RepID=A0A8K0GJM4_IGNLU|nr:hypothetical protein ILUMI_04384 [Ignelater luminosus]